MKSRIGATQSTKKLDIRKLKSSEPGLFRGTLLCRSSRLFSFTEILAEKRTMTGDQETGGLVGLFWLGLLCFGNLSCIFWVDFTKNRPKKDESQGGCQNC